MKYEIGDLVKDEDENEGVVVISWNDGDICPLENDAAHPNPVIVGHWKFKETATEIEKQEFLWEGGKHGH